MVRRNIILLAGLLLFFCPGVLPAHHMGGTRRPLPGGDPDAHAVYGRRPAVLCGNSGTYQSADGGLSWTALCPAPMHNLRCTRPRTASMWD